MKSTCLLLLVALSVTLLPAAAEDWTVNGKDYVNVAVGKVEPDRVHITYNGGIGTVMLSDLSPELQKRFNYDPVQAKAATKAQALHDAESDAAAAAQAKVDQANLQKSDADAEKQRTAVMAPKTPSLKSIKYLAGTVMSAVNGGYDIYLPPFPKSTGDALTPAYLPKDPYPRIGYDIDVVLKTSAVHTVGEVVLIPAVEDGVVTDSTGNNYRAFIPVAASP